ncbi:MAG TPA: biotin/lipoyl-containing protein [Candidatus Limnocylindrales bacterium]
MSAEREEPREGQPMADARPAGEAGQAEPVEPVAVGPGDPVEAHRPDGGEGPAPTVEEAANRPDGEDASLLSLVDRLAAVLEHSDLGELEVTAGGTTIILRAPSAIERTMTLAGPASAAEGPAAPAGGVPVQAPATAASAPAAAPAAAPAVRPSVKAPLTGIFYGAPSPGATAYVAVGDHVSVGQIIGLIEAMKLFNEIKSDLAGRVVRICADNGALVKARQPLIEVEPA